jgi:hypothetical protein
MIAERHGRLEAVPTVRVSAVRSSSVAWARVLSLLAFPAFLGWTAARPSALRERVAQAAQALVAVARGSAVELASADEGGGERSSLLASRRAAHRSGGPAIIRRPWLGRADGASAGDTALRAARAERLWDVAHRVRAHVDVRAEQHLPSGEPSPYDATAPPSATRRDG